MRSNGFLLIALGSLLISSAFAATYTGTFAASASNSILSSGNVCGRCTSLAVSDTGVAALIKWDISSLPSDAVISSATISLEITSSGSDLPTLAITTATAAWNQSINGAGKSPLVGDLPIDGDPTWTYSAQPYTLWANAGASGGSAFLNMATSTNTIGDPDLLSQAIGSAGIAILQSWITSASNNRGLVVRLSSASGSVIFGSHNNADTLTRPTISITYDTTAGAPPPPTKSVNYAPPPGRLGIGVPVRGVASPGSGAIVGGIIGGIMGVFVIITIATIFIRS